MELIGIITFGIAAVFFWIFAFGDPAVERINVSRRGIAFFHFGTQGFIAWSEVSWVALVRDESAFPDFQFGYHTETEWVIRGMSKSTTLGYSWLDRWKLYWAFTVCLPRFDSRLARAGLHSWRRGKWICYDHK
jgi:hypothetical protein